MTALARQLRTIAEACGGAVRESDHQWSCLCPAHNDGSPSLRVGAGDDGRPTVECLAGCEYADVRSALLPRGVPADLLRPTGTRKAFGGRPRRGQAQRGPDADAKPLPGDAAVAKWHDALITDEGPLLTYLREKRGLAHSTLLRHEIGRHYGKFTIPVRDEDRELVNVRKYDHAATKNKMTNHSGHGAARLYPMEVLAEEPDEPVLLCEGEWDALVANQHGFVAVTGTGGAKNPPKDLSPLQDRSVYVVYDCDDAGRRGARAVARQLLPVAKEVYVVDLGLGESEDVTDWFVAHGKSEEELLALLSDASPVTPEDVDDDEDDDGLLVSLADVQETRLDWVWPGRIPAGKLTILEGDPGLGKSMLWTRIVADITTGEPLPGDDRAREPLNALVICAEDDLGDTIVPRLRAAGADVNRVAALGLQRDDKGHLIPLSIPEDLPRLRKAIRKARAAVVVFDPISAYLSETINSGNDSSVRRALTPLGEIAQTTGAAVLMVRHLNKQGDLKALYRGGGSIAFIGAARSGLVVDRHPEDPRTLVLAQTKANLARDIPALTYSVDSWYLDDAIPVVTWGEELEMDADALLRKTDGRRDTSGRDAVVAFLRELLSDGPVPATAVRAAAKDAGIAWRSVERYKDEATARTRAKRDDTGKTREWEWFIPTIRIVREDETP